MTPERGLTRGEPDRPLYISTNLPRVPDPWFWRWVTGWSLLSIAITMAVRL